MVCLVLMGRSACVVSQMLGLKTPTGRAACICHPIHPNLVDLHNTISLCASTQPKEVLTVRPTIQTVHHGMLG